LATLEAYIDGLEDGVVAPSEESYATMRGQVSRLRRLATDLRESAAADEHALHLAPVVLDAAAAAADAVAAATPRYLAKGVELTLAPGAPGLPVSADAERLGQVLSNLLDNALRHTPPGGHVRVTATSDRSEAVIVVTDDGDGIPPDQIGSIFERFHRVDPARASTDGSGSGLGLTIARAIITDHGGTLTVSSPGPGAGATFRLALPALA
jgi:signal transduction histidine kinase